MGKKLQTEILRETFENNFFELANEPITAILINEQGLSNSVVGMPTHHTKKCKRSKF